MPWPRRLSLVTGVALVLLSTRAHADVELAPIVVIDFSDYEGAGFSPTPARGQLDSDDWSITLRDDIVLPFGGTAGAATTFANGAGEGNTDSTGIWAFDVDGAGLIALGVQPGDQTFTPGRMALRVVNNTGAEITRFQVEYNVWVRNDVERASSFDLQQSADNVTYVDVGGGFTSPAAPDENGFTPTPVEEVVTPAAPIANGAQYYLAWAGDDANDAESTRDEFGLEGITIRLLEICGNGLVEKDETCDDTNDVDGDGCSADCLLEEEPTTSGGSETSAGESETGADSSGGDDTDATATSASTTTSTSTSATDPTTDASATTMTGGGTTETATENGESSGGGTGENEDTSGCSCTTSSHGTPIWAMLGLLGLTRRRARGRRCMILEERA